MSAASVGSALTQLLAQDSRDTVGRPRSHSAEYAALGFVSVLGQKRAKKKNFNKTEQQTYPKLYTSNVSWPLQRNQIQVFKQKQTAHG